MFFYNIYDFVLPKKFSAPGEFLLNYSDLVLPLYSQLPETSKKPPGGFLNRSIF